MVSSTVRGVHRRQPSIEAPPTLTSYNDIKKSTAVCTPHHTSYLVGLISYTGFFGDGTQEEIRESALLQHVSPATLHTNLYKNAAFWPPPSQDPAPLWWPFSLGGILLPPHPSRHMINHSNSTTSALNSVQTRRVSVAPNKYGNHDNSTPSVFHSVQASETCPSSALHSL